MSHEIELKLEVSPEAADRLMRESWLEGVQQRSARQVSTYYDTADRALRERGYTLRVRSSGKRFIQTVKSLDHGAGLFARGEWEYEVEGPRVDPEALSPTPLAGLDTANLQPVVRSDVERTACRLRRDGAEIELDIDRGLIAADGSEEPVSEIEIELIRGEPALALEVARAIAGHVPVRLGVMSKAERGFALADGKLGRVSKAEGVRIQPGMTVAQGFETIVNACLRHFRLNEALVVEQRTPEALHQTRVAMRRLRAAMSLFRTVVADPEFAAIRDELRWFTGELGDARNLDVYLQRRLPAAERREIRQRREAAYDEVIAAMDSSRFRSMMLDLVAWAALGEWHGHANAGMALEPYVSRRIDRLWSKIRAAGHHMKHMGDEERHELRILIKKLRYALEFVEALHVHESPRQKKFFKAVQDLQESLGALNDIVVARAMSAVEAWPIVPEEPSEDERRLLRESDDALERLRDVGPYWR